nr:InlB B-repeat-containing protein [Clostridia bacterium]
LNNPERTGYTFLGWFEDIGYENRINNISDRTNATGDINLYPKYELCEYNINYSGASNGGNPKKYTIESDFTFKNPPKTGYKFLGWFEDAEYKKEIKKITDRTNTTGDIKLYPKFELCEYNINYNIDSGVYNGGNPTKYTVESYFYLKNPEKTGYKFLGWYEDAEYKKEIRKITDRTNTTGNINLYPKWIIKEVKITLACKEICDNCNEVIKFSPSYKTNPVTITNTSDTRLPVYSNKYYEFLGYYNQAGEQITDKEGYPINGPWLLENDITLYSHWEKILNLANEMKDYSFSAFIKTESTLQGKATFNVTGIPVIYNGAEYIYGNAYYEGNLNGSRFNDVDRISLLLENTTALFGGLISWQGTQGDSNESGSAAWDSIYTHDSNELSYLHKNPCDDFAGNENIKIAVNGICVKVGTPTKEISSYAQIVKTSFYSNIYTESTNQGRIKFDVYGINVSYNNCEYIYGCAYYNGQTGGQRFNDVSQIALKNSSVEILNGGVMLYRGTKGDVNESGVYSCSNLKVNSTECYFMAENGGNDFAGNKNVTITITNICIKVSNNLSSDKKYLEIIERDFCCSLYAETSYKDYIRFSALGIEVIYNDNIALLGYAGYKGKIELGRLNDCDSITLKFDDSIAIYGGYLHYTGNHDDWNTQGTLTSYSKTIRDTLIYYADNCADDFPGNSVSSTTIYINGICIIIK